MRRVFRIILAIVKWFAILGVAALPIVLLVNLRDEELTPEARSLAEFLPPSVPDGQNAYLAMVGFDAPVGVDPIVAGARIVAESNTASSSDPWANEYVSKLKSQGSTVPDEGRLKFIETAGALYDPLVRPCLPQALEHAHDIRAMTDANAEPVARYLAMQRLPAFANTSLPGILQANLNSGRWSGPRQLLLMRSALDAQTGQVSRALEFLAADIGMWRRVLRGGGNLIDEMIAVRGLAADFRVLSDLIAAPSFGVVANEAELRQILEPLSPAELNAAPMFKKEFEMHARLVAALPEEVAKDRSEAWIDRLVNGSMFFPILYKPNASLNLSAQYYSSLQTLASHSPSDFVHLREKVEGETRAMSKPSITWIYNPIGRTLVGIAAPAYEDYVARVFDLAAYVQLVRAQLEVRLAAVAPGQVSAFLASAGPETRNPYTEQPFQWNAADNTLSFEPMSNRWREWATSVAVPRPL